MSRTVAAAVAVGAALSGLVLLATDGTGGSLVGPLRNGAKWVLGTPARLRRAGVTAEEPPFSHLAASQVGYAPAMTKQFSAPRPFRSFSVRDERTGAEVLRGGGPTRRIATELLGPVPEVWVGDFSSLEAPGRYRLIADSGISSRPFDVGPRVFDAAIRAIQRVFYFQRASSAVDAEHAEGPWTRASDAHLFPRGELGGWHDAGDFSLYSASTNSALFWLLQAWSDFAPADDDTNIPESGNGVPDLLDEIRWGLNWLLSVQEGSGGFRNTTCQESYGPYGTNAPDRAHPYVRGDVGPLATGRAVGTLAFASAVFAAIDPPFAARCLDAARFGYRFLEARPDEHGDGPTCPAYRQDGDRRVGRDVRMYAAAGLLLATGEPRYRGAFEASYQELDNDPSAYRFNVFAALLYLRAQSGNPERKEAIRARLRALGHEVLGDGEAHPFQWATRYFWGSVAAGFHRTGAFSIPACLADRVSQRAHCEQALANVHYVLGRNLRQFCYVSGLPGVTHGRTHAFHQWLASLDARPFVFPGMVAGGPTTYPVEADVSYPHGRPRPVWGYWGDPAMHRDRATPVDGRYTDNDSWSTNEIDIDWQAVTLYSLFFARWWSGGGSVPATQEPVPAPGR